MIIELSHVSGSKEHSILSRTTHTQTPLSNNRSGFIWDRRLPLLFALPSDTEREAHRAGGSAKTSQSWYWVFYPITVPGSEPHRTGVGSTRGQREAAATATKVRFRLLGVSDGPLFYFQNPDDQMILQWILVMRLFSALIPLLLSDDKGARPTQRGAADPRACCTRTCYRQEYTCFARERYRTLAAGKGWDTADPTVGDVHQVKGLKRARDYPSSGGGISTALRWEEEG